MDFPDSSVGKEASCHAGDPGWIPASGRSAGEGIGCPLQYSWASLVAQLVKNSPAVRETWVLCLGWEDPLEKGKATHSSIPTPELYSPWDHKELDMTERLSLHACVKAEVYADISYMSVMSLSILLQTQKCFAK